MTIPVTVQHVVFDASDPRRVATFWSHLLNRPIGDDWGDFIRLEPDEAGTRLAFATVPEPKTTKNRVHLDVTVDDRERTCEELVGLGAEVVDTRTAGEHTWTVMTDPEGNEFCIAES